MRVVSTVLLLFFLPKPTYKNILLLWDCIALNVGKFTTSDNKSNKHKLKVYYRRLRVALWVEKQHFETLLAVILPTRFFEGVEIMDRIFVVVFEFFTRNWSDYLVLSKNNLFGGLALWLSMLKLLC